MQKEKISRHQFLKSMGLGGSALVAVYCASTALSSCTNESGAVIPAGGLTLDLTSSANAALKITGGFVVQNSIVIANIGGGKYVAVTQVCSHEGKKQVIYQNSEFYCTAHGARFDTAGKGLNANGKGGLKTYTVSVSGNTLTLS